MSADRDTITLPLAIAKVIREELSGCMMRYDSDEYRAREFLREAIERAPAPQTDRGEG